MNRVPGRALAAGSGAALAVGVAAYATLVEPRRLVVRELELWLPHWPAGLDGLRVGALSDTHAGGPNVREPMLDRVGEALHAAAPDLVVFLGDLVDPHGPLGTDLAPERAAAPFAGLRPPLGAFAVMGNHDWKQPHPSRVATALEGAGMSVLEDEAIDTGRGLWVAGFADIRSRRVHVGRALREVPGDAAVLAITHSPDLFPHVPARVSLTLAGHTHGGQLNLPLVRRRVIPSTFGDRYAAGHIEEEGRHLYVTRGVGTSLLPVRLFAPPEVVVLTLRSG